MSIALMNAAWRLDVPASKKLVMLAMCDWSNDEGTSCHPSIAAIAKRASMSPRQAQRVVHELIDQGWLRVVGNWAGGKSGSTRQYHLNVAAIMAGGLIHTGDTSDTGDKLARVTPAANTGVAHDTPRVTSKADTGVTGVTQTTIDPPDNHQRNHHSERARTANAGVRFPEFWAAYPNKTARPQCLAKWKAKHLDAIADRILADVARKAAQDRRWLEGYVPNPATYLNQERWNDPVQPRLGPPVGATPVTGKQTALEQSNRHTAAAWAGAQSPGGQVIEEEAHAGS